MTKYQTNEEKEEIVSKTLAAIKDKKIRRMCRLYMGGYSDEEISQKLAIPPHVMEEYKSIIRKELLKAGYKPKE